MSDTLDATNINRNEKKNTRMKIPFVREWGSWAVFFSSIFAGLLTGLMTKPWLTDRNYSLKTVLTILGLTLLINSKNPLASVLRTRGAKKEHVMWVLLFSLTGTALLLPFLIEGTRPFLIFSLLILSYVILLSLGREHHLVTELNGFALLTLSAPIIYFVITGDLSLRLYAAVLIFFAAGVFKVRARVKKTLAYRWLMIVYCAAAFTVYAFLNIAVILLIPLVENVISVLLMREEKLKTTGDTELIKGVVFIILMGFFWQ